MNKLRSACKTQFQEVTAQRSMDLLSQRETKQTYKLAQKGKMRIYKGMRLLLEIYASVTAAVISQGISNVNSKGTSRNEAAVVGLVMSVGLMGYSMNYAKKELIKNQIKSLRKQHWGYKPTPSQAWASVVGKTR